VQINVYARDNTLLHSIKKRLLGTTSVRNFRNAMQRAFQLQGRHYDVYRITYAVDQEQSELKILFDNDLRELGFYELESGEEVRIVLT
jgi:hypothetical protein